MSKLQIRPAREDDVSAITEIYNHAIRNTTATFDTVEKSVDDRRQWLAEHDECYPVVVALASRKVVGWGSLSRYGERPAWRFTVENAVYVSPDFQGHGVGKRILEHLVCAAESLGYRAIIAQVVAGNEASYRVHESCGFETVGVLKQVGHKFDQWLDVVLMERDLGRGAGGQGLEDEGWLRYYDLEHYLLETVRPRFHAQGYLSAFDFFCIVIWKANRAKTKIAKRLLAHSYTDLEDAARGLTAGIAQQSSSKERLRYLWESWGFRLPMGTAILTVLYPDDFTVYDQRVCDSLGEFHNLNNITKFENVWPGYEEYRREVEMSTPTQLSLRDKDRYLWGKSFHHQLGKDIDSGFGHLQPRKE